jgi:hypothetical protein
MRAASSVDSRPAGNRPETNTRENIEMNTTQTAPHTVERCKVIKIPFAGTYESIFSHELDHAAEMESYNRVEDGSNEGDESSYPEALRLDESTISSEYLYAVDCPAAFESMAADYADAFAGEVDSALGIDSRIRFESMDSPREYNFTTDRLFVYMSESAIREIWAAHAADKFETLAQVIERRHRSRDGFHSFYSADLESWINDESGAPRDPLTFDHNESETLLIAAFELPANARHKPGAAVSDLNEAMRDAEMSVCEYWSGNAGADNFLDWDKYQAELNEARAEKLAAVYEESPEDAAAILDSLESSYADGYAAVCKAFAGDYPQESAALHELRTGRPMRCPETADLFAGE